MFYLLLAVLCSASITLILRFATGKYENRYAMLCANYITCVVIGFIYLPNKNILPSSSGSKTAFWLGIINGALYLGCMLLQQINVQKNGAIMTATFGRLGLLLPTIGVIVLFGEMPTWVQIIGIILAVFAVVYINLPGKKAQEELSAVHFKTGLLLLLLVSGLSDGMSKVFELMGERDFDGLFLFYTFAMALVFSLILLVSTHKKFTWKDAATGVAIGVPNYLSTLFLLKALTQLKAFIVYPSYSVGAIITVSLVSVLLFHERLTKRQIIGVCIIATSLLLLNM